MPYARKINLKDLVDFIYSFHKDYGVTPNTALLTNRYKVNPATIRRNLKRLNNEGKINYKDSGKYNTKYTIK